jgi:hypothetical protein
MLAFSALVAGSFSLGALVANDIDPAALNACASSSPAAVLAGWRWSLPRHGGFRRHHFRAPWRYVCWRRCSPATSC